MGRHRLRAHNVADNRDEKDWLTTYADVVTLLLTFFILMITVTSVDHAKVEKLKEGIAASVSKEEFVKNDFTQVQQSLEEVLETYDTRDQVAIEQTPKGVEIEFSNVTLYDSGSAEVKTDAIPILNSVSLVLATYASKGFTVEVSGHTDDVSISTEKFPSNWELSAARATQIVRYFIDKGIPPSVLKASGFADSRSKFQLEAGQKYSSEQRSQNRRVIILITK